MIRTVLKITIFLFLTSDLSYAHGDEHSGHVMPKSTDVEVKGQLIGMTCFIKHDSKGEEHKSCFKECAEKGLPIGVLTKDNKIYQISGKGHEDLKETNKKFIKFAEEKVILKGEVFSSKGMNMIVVKGIKKD